MDKDRPVNAGMPPALQDVSEKLAAGAIGDLMMNAEIVMRLIPAFQDGESIELQFGAFPPAMDFMMMAREPGSPRDKGRT